jgi:hypothetical protein
MQKHFMKENCTERTPNTRSRTPEPPYCWQNKEARRHIREKMNGHESTSSVLSLYAAMTEEASNQESEVFAAGQPYLGELSGLSARSVRRLERLLEEFGVIEIKRPNLRGHHTYKLLAFGQEVPTLGHNGPTLGHGANQGSCPPVEVTTEVTTEGTTEVSANGSKNRRVQQEVTSDFIAQQQIHFPHLDVEQEARKARAWISARPPRRFTRRFFVEWLKRAKKPAAPAQKEEW